jgi:DNA-binding HxlR family transcriptional regulator
MGHSRPVSFHWQEGTSELYTYRTETIGILAMAAAPRAGMLPKKEALVHEMLERIADKWTLLVIDALDGEKELRFSRLQERVGGVSQKMLTKTLRQLERDGLVTRRVHATVPPRVDYSLTRLGEELGQATCAVWLWVEAHADAMQRSRRKYDKRRGG